MNKDKFYVVIKNTIHRKFNELEVVERNETHDLYLHYNNKEYAEIKVEKKSGKIFYHYKFRDKLIKLIPMEHEDFEILLMRWIEDNFQIKVNNARQSYEYDIDQIKLN